MAKLTGIYPFFPATNLIAAISCRNIGALETWENSLRPLIFYLIHLTIYYFGSIEIQNLLTILLNISLLGSNHSNTSVVLMMTIWIIDLFWIPLLDTINNPLALGVPSNFFVAQEIGQQLKQILLLTMFKVWLGFF